MKRLTDIKQAIIIVILAMLFLTVTGIHAHLHAAGAGGTPVIVMNPRNSPIPVLVSRSAGTVEINRVTAVSMQSEQIGFHLTFGPFPVAAYSQIRLFTGLATVSGMTNVHIFVTDANGESFATLDSFPLDAGTAATTRIYDVPGQYVKVEYWSNQLNSINFALFGR